MQESRLFKIIYYLLAKGSATAPELAERLEVSVRTIYRDVDALSAAGIPVYTEAGRNGGIHLLDHFVLDRTVLSEKEKQEILTALQSFTTVGNARESDILDKLSALFRVPAENWFEVDFSRWTEDQWENEKFELLKLAVLHCKCVQITYANSCETITERIIQPLKLSYKSMAWYVKAYCTKKQDYRIFKLTRIMDLKLLDDSFPPFPPHSFPEPKDIPRQKLQQITLRFPKEMAYRVYDEFDIRSVKRQDNGDLLVSARIPNEHWLIGYLLSFGANVEIIEPAGLKKIIAEQAKIIYHNNKI